MLNGCLSEFSQCVNKEIPPVWYVITDNLVPGFKIFIESWMSENRTELIDLTEIIRQIKIQMCILSTVI